MSVEFVVRAADLRRATNQLNANRGKHNQSDFADILVSECAATFRSVGTEAEVPVEGKHPGPVRLPLRVLDAIKRVMPTMKQKELTLLCEPGVIKIGTWSLKHPDIELGRIPDQRLNLPIDVSVLDTLALADILTADQFVEEGMRPPIQEAFDTRTRVVAAALTALQPLDITERQLQDLVDTHIRDAAGRLRRSLRIP